MKKNKILIAVFALLAAASAAGAEDIKVDFDGKKGAAVSFADLLKNADSCQNDKIACVVPVPEKTEINQQTSQNKTSEVKAVLKWPDGRMKKGLVVCSGDKEGLSCSVSGNLKGKESDFFLAGLMRNMIAPSFNKHSYDNWSGPMLFSCTDVCRDVKRWVGQTVTWTKTCGASTTVSTTELSGEAGCTVTTSTEDKYEIERQCYTHECVCVKGC